VIGLEGLLSTSASAAPTFGIYLYGWYDPPKWQAHKHLHVPQIGYYDSSDQLVIVWQVEQIRRAGIDYVVFETVPVNDISFVQCMTQAEKFIEAIAGTGIGYTFMIDFGVMAPGRDPLAEYDAIVTELERRGWLGGIIDIPGRGKSIFTFSLYPDLVPVIRTLTSGDLELYCASWSPDWDIINPSKYDPRLAAFFERHWRPAIEKGIRYADAVEPLGFIQFWQPPEQTLSLNGFASICPGYDELLLKRDPQIANTLSRDDGRNLVRQFQAAVASGARDMLIYSWNEHFEAAGIEPTVQFGDFYLELTRSLIAQAKAGQDIKYPTDLVPLRPVAPLYLNSDLERSGQKHVDGIPRWRYEDASQTKT
jgi:hypothetical protein